VVSKRFYWSDINAEIKALMQDLAEDRVSDHLKFEEYRKKK
jgi:hypothetical protein